MEHAELQRNVRILATLRETEFPVISCYLNAEQSIAECRAFLAERIPLLRRTIPAAQRQSFDQSLEHIDSYVNENAKEPDVRGIVVFVRSMEDPFLLCSRFHVPVVNQLTVDRVPHICQLMALKNIYDRYVVVLMNKKRASILEINLGAVTRQTWSEHPVPPDRVGRQWSKERYLGEKLLKGHTPEMLALVDRCRNRARRIDRIILEMENARHDLAPKGSKGALAQLSDWYNHLELECVFLQNKKCVIYSDRPLACRSWLATGSPAFCRTTRDIENNQVNSVNGINMSAILVEMTRRYLGRHEIVTLPAIINWYERHKKEYQQSYPVQDLVQTFLESITHHFQQHSEHASIRFRQIF